LFQVDNPVSVLTQEMSKQFLQSKNEGDKYKVRVAEVNAKPPPQNTSRQITDFIPAHVVDTEISFFFFLNHLFNTVVLT
jgi:hypothetical protein